MPMGEATFPVNDVPLFPASLSRIDGSPANEHRPEFYGQRTEINDARI